MLAFDLSGAVSRRGDQVARSPCRCRPISRSKRPVDERDRTDYQTIYAREDGAVAAPTAGLHFTDDLLHRLRRRGHRHRDVTLHVGAGTFLPVKADDTEDHRMHAEMGRGAGRRRRARSTRRDAAGGRIVAVGTTPCGCSKARRDETGDLQPFSGATDIFITPGYRFRAVDMLMTNFHLPRSTLFMLVSAFSGLETMKAA